MWPGKTYFWHSALYSYSHTLLTENSLLMVSVCLFFSCFADLKSENKFIGDFRHFQHADISLIHDALVNTPVLI